MPTAEDEYFQLVINHPDLGRLSLTPEDFSKEREQKLMSRLLEQMAAGKISIAAVHDEFETADREWLLTLSTEDREFADPVAREAQLAGSIRLKRQRDRLDAVSARIRQGTATSEEMAEHKDLLRRVKGSARV